VVLNSYIGGVKVFLGPAFGAALMTFFGYAVSDLTRSWLLYQGILFVVVMLFMPSGLAGLVGTTARLRQRFGWGRLLPLALLSVGAALLVAAGATFAIEMLQRAFSQDYRALANLQLGQAWPPIAYLGRDWAPASPATWAVPLGLAAVGALLAQMARMRFRALTQAESAAAPSEVLAARTGGLA